MLASAVAQWFHCKSFTVKLGMDALQALMINNEFYLPLCGTPENSGPKAVTSPYVGLNT